MTALARRKRGRSPGRPHLRRTFQPPNHHPDAWPGADPTLGATRFLDQLPLWDTIAMKSKRGGPPDGPLFDPAGAEVRRIPPAGSKRLIGDFLALHHYSGGAGMRGLAFGLYRGSALLGVAVFSRVCRPRWAAENFSLLPADVSRSATQRRHLRVTEAEYTVLSRFALAAVEAGGEPTGKGAATWFLSRCMAGLEARNRALWAAYQRLARGYPLGPVQLRLLAEAATADSGRGRGFIKAVTTWADPYENMLGRIYQLLSFHYCGRTNGGAWTRERVGTRSGRRLSARTVAKAGSPSTPGHAQAALRLAWEGADVWIHITSTDGKRRFAADWVRGVLPAGRAPSETELSAAIAAAWHSWRRENAPAGGQIELRSSPRSGTRLQHFPAKHAYFTGLGAPWYCRQTEIRFRPLTARLLAEEQRRDPRRRRVDRRREFYPTAVLPHEVRPDLRCETVPLIEIE